MIGKGGFWGRYGEDCVRTSLLSSTLPIVFQMGSKTCHGMQLARCFRLINGQKRGDGSLYTPDAQILLSVD